jgi:hypothetical protein
VREGHFGNAVQPVTHPAPAFAPLGSILRLPELKDKRKGGDSSKAPEAVKELETDVAALYERLDFQAIRCTEPL